MVCLQRFMIHIRFQNALWDFKILNVEVVVEV